METIATPPGNFERADRVGEASNPGKLPIRTMTGESTVGPKKDLDIL
jgi:hypothetical protein